MDNQWKKAAGEAIAHSGWVLLFSPRVLFLLGTLQALTPYLWWYLEGTNPHYRFQITYIPLLVWVVGYLCFCIGTFFATRARPGRIQDDGLSLRRARIYTSLLLVVALGEVLAVIRAYGTVPIFAYLSGQATVNEVDASNWWQMKYGQLGALQLTLYFLNGLLLLTMLKTIRARGRSRVLILTSLALLLFGASFSGKRQGVAITVVFIGCGLAIRFGNPFGALLRALKLPRTRLVRAAAFAIAALGFVSFIGVMPSLRTGAGGVGNGPREMLHYLSFPLMNYESECATVGLGPSRLNFLDPLRSMVPRRSLVPGTLPFNDPPVHPEPTSPSGFYSQVQWGLGAVGAWVFAALCGLFSQHCFSRAGFSTAYLLIYSQISWALLAAHSYNHFLNLNYVPVPVVGFALFSWFAARTGARQSWEPTRPLRPRPGDAQV